MPIHKCKLTGERLGNPTTSCGGYEKNLDCRSRLPGITDVVRVVHSTRLLKEGRILVNNLAPVDIAAAVFLWFGYGRKKENGRWQLPLPAKRKDRTPSKDPSNFLTPERRLAEGYLSVFELTIQNRINRRCGDYKPRGKCSYSTYLYRLKQSNVDSTRCTSAFLSLEVLQFGAIPVVSVLLPWGWLQARKARYPLQWLPARCKRDVKPA